MRFSSSRFSLHGGVAYHRNGSETQEILEINRHVEGVGRTDDEALPLHRHALKLSRVAH